MAMLIEQQVLEPGNELTGQRDGATAVVTDNYGLAGAGVRYPLPVATGGMRCRGFLSPLRPSSDRSSLMQFSSPLFQCD